MSEGQNAIEEMFEKAWHQGYETAKKQVSDLCRQLVLALTDYGTEERLSVLTLRALVEKFASQVQALHPPEGPASEETT